MLSPTSLKLLQYYPAPNLPGTAQQPAGAERRHRQRRSVPGARRSEHRQQDPAERCATTGTTASTSNVFNAAIPAHRGDAAARQQQLAGRLHPHAEAEPAQRFPHRLPPHRLRHAQPVRGRRIPTPAPSLGIPGFDGDVQVQQSGPAEHQRQQLQRSRRRRHQLVPVRHHVPGRRTCSRTRRARTTCGPASTCGGSRPAGAPRTIRAGCSAFTGDITGYVDGRLHARPAAHGDPADRSDPGPRRRLAQRLLRQRRLAAGAQPHAEPGPALRAEHAGADLRRAGDDAGRGLRDDHSGDAAVARASSSTSRTTRTSRRGSAPPIASARRPCCAPASGSTTTRTR